MNIRYAKYKNEYKKQKSNNSNDTVLSFVSTCSAATLPPKVAKNLGNIYLVSDDFVTTDEFTCGAGQRILKGSYVIVVYYKDKYYYSIFDKSKDDESLAYGGAIPLLYKSQLPKENITNQWYHVLEDNCIYWYDKQLKDYKCIKQISSEVHIYDGNVNN